NLNNKGIKKAVELIEYDRLSPEQLHQMKVDAQRRVVRKLDEEKARKEGVEEGLEKGAEKERIKMAKTMKKEGEPIDKISKYTGLSKEEIEKL
ncbi:MAG: hypothetical protein GTO45_00010, partial [Candidatus Aminicenantes bacterium]|nr:hypothetical protein [Candidatus Aminicenantes bacterium]NIM77150.1 hypothetical protein [Candidatus Aminicenantes bacterium]NIN16443.1 hypothetical protein [Candidatus Aminicenantes bacterium]NIN40304.1 hypothetical protein [Candidatus Aminicenantes bacterium]NIN83123.1 hypothetical protein [Candidatus Aminicenantes bacterium]